MMSGPVSAVEKVFGVKLNVYRHPTETRTFHAPGTQPSINLSVPVLDVSGLDSYSRPHPNYVLSPAKTERGGAERRLRAGQ